MSALRRPWLAPLSAVYAGALAAKNFLYSAGHTRTRELAWPVISVGSLSVGGAGKTPFTLLLAQALEQDGWRPDVLSRGYGRSSRDCLQVQPTGKASQFGDEPLLLAQHGMDVFVAPQRYDAGRLAEQQLDAATHRVHLVDDGFQHRQLARTLDLVLLTAEDWHDWLLPAGNLREPKSSLLRADAIFLREDEAAELEAPLRNLLAKKNAPAKIFFLRRELALSSPPPHALAFCALARPQNFFAMLKAAGCNLAGTVAFRDHAPYTVQSAETLVQQAKAVNADGFITTEKDAVKLVPTLRIALEQVGPLAIAPLQTEFCDKAAVMQWLLAKLHREAAR